MFLIICRNVCCIKCFQNGTEINAYKYMVVKIISFIQGLRFDLGKCKQCEVKGQNTGLCLNFLYC